MLIYPWSFSVIFFRMVLVQPLIVFFGELHVMKKVVNIPKCINVSLIFLLLVVFIIIYITDPVKSLKIFWIY